ncbi:MAG: hypothetical protein RLZZ299_998 [Pseudomonadota bacterium]|jgi:hypothetical protein
MVSVLLLAMLTGCGVGPVDTLSEAWRIDRLRVLGVAAEPAEAHPGDVVSFRALVVSPGAPVGAVVWLACLQGDASGNGCTPDASVFTEAFADGAVDAAEQQALQDAGLVGVEPFLAPSWTIPATALDGLPEDARVEGFSAFVNVSALPGTADGASGAAPVDVEAGLQADDVELAFKRLPISSNPQPNRNPSLDGIEVDGVLVADGGAVEVAAGAQVELSPSIPDDSREAYVFRTRAGVDEPRTEELWVQWYAEDGAFEQDVSVDPFLDRAWTAPGSAGTVGMWVVVRDRRGGMAWTSLTVRVR